MFAAQRGNGQPALGLTQHAHDPGFGISSSILPRKLYVRIPLTKGRITTTLTQRTGQPVPARLTIRKYNPEMRSCSPRQPPPEPKAFIASMIGWVAPPGHSTHIGHVIGHRLALQEIAIV